MNNMVVMTDEKVSIFSKRELMTEGQILDVADIQKLFSCGSDKAYSIIRAIKSVSDMFELAGKIHVMDYKLYVDTMVARGKGYKIPLPQEAEN